MWAAGMLMLWRAGRGPNGLSVSIALWSRGPSFFQNARRFRQRKPRVPDKRHTCRGSMHEQRCLAMGACSRSAGVDKAFDVMKQRQASPRSSDPRSPRPQGRALVTISYTLAEMPLAEAMRRRAAVIRAPRSAS